MSEHLKQSDPHWNEIDVMARVREAKRRKAAAAKTRLMIALAQAAERRTKAAAPTRIADIMPRRRVAVRWLQSADGRDLALGAVDGPSKEVATHKQGLTTTKVSLPFNRFIHEEG